MAPKNIDTLHLADDTSLKDEVQSMVTQESHAVSSKRPPRQIVWRNVFWLGYMHMFALYGLYMFAYASPKTWIWCKYTRPTVLK